MEARGWGIVGVLQSTVIHSNVTETYTEGHWAPERKRGLWKQTGLFNYHRENNMSLLVIWVQPHQAPLPAAFAFAEDSAWRCRVVVGGGC